jgi:hypothetical protein
VHRKVGGAPVFRGDWVYFAHNGSSPRRGEHDLPSGPSSRLSLAAFFCASQNWVEVLRTRGGEPATTNCCPGRPRLIPVRWKKCSRAWLMPGWLPPASTESKWPTKRSSASGRPCASGSTPTARGFGSTVTSPKQPKSGRSSGELYRGARLTQAAEWAGEELLRFKLPIEMTADDRLSLTWAPA